MLYSNLIIAIAIAYLSRAWALRESFISMFYTIVPPHLLLYIIVGLAKGEVAQWQRLKADFLRELVRVEAMYQ